MEKYKKNPSCLLQFSAAAEGWIFCLKREVTVLL